MAELLNLEEVKGYLRLDGSEEDAFLGLLIVAARSFCETRLNRPLLTDKMTDATRWEVPEEIKVAMLMLIAHWYENRGVIGKVEGQLSFSVDALVGPHKFHTFGSGSA